jgi:hypothetical protein
VSDTERRLVDTVVAEYRACPEFAVCRVRDVGGCTGAAVCRLVVELEKEGEHERE